jgi:hypothetical protein
MFFNLGHPVFDRLKGVSLGNVINNDKAVCLIEAVVADPYLPDSLVTSDVPYLK